MIFCGEHWRQDSQTSLIAELMGFFEDIVHSSLIDQLKEYSAPNYQIGSGGYLGTKTITEELGNTIDDAVIQIVLQNEINSNDYIPKLDANTLYVLF